MLETMGMSREMEALVDLEMRFIDIKDVQFSERSYLDQGILQINPEEALKIIRQDFRIKEAYLHLARPGESVRIAPVKDVIEPRTKEGGMVFPGMEAEVQEVGFGITYALRGCAVTTTGPIVGFQEGLLDMSGPAAAYTPFSKLNHVVLEIRREEGLEPHEHEEAVRKAGIRLARYLGEVGKSCKEYDPKVYTWKTLMEKAREHGDLPKVIYVYPCMSQGLLHDTYFYGRDTKQMVSTLISPLEVFDGALVSGNCVSPGSKTTTWHHQNNAILEECFLRHGQELNFIGVILHPLMTRLEEKVRNAALTGKIAEMLGAQGAVISQEGFGNPTTDLMMLCRILEGKGIKTVLITNEDAGEDGFSQSLPDGTPEGDAIISTGNSNAKITLPAMDKVIGKLEDLEKTTGGWKGCLHEQGQITVEVHGIIGSHNLQGNTHLSGITI